MKDILNVNKKHMIINKEEQQGNYIELLINLEMSIDN